MGVCNFYWKRLGYPKPLINLSFIIHVAEFKLPLITWMKSTLYSRVDEDIESIIWFIIFGVQSWHYISKALKLYICFDSRIPILVVFSTGD